MYELSLGVFMPSRQKYRKLEMDMEGWCNHLQAKYVISRIVNLTFTIIANILYFGLSVSYLK